MSKGTSRRNFLKTTAVAGVGYWVAGGVGIAAGKSALETVNFASIGVGGKGESDSADANRSGNLVAICDIDEENLGRAAARYPKAKKFNDYRKMLDDMGKSIDAVTVSTPDHHHAPASLRAMRMGKHCFTQKPMTHSLEEARLMGQVARENKLATQMGNQGTAESSLREAAAVIQSGALGPVTQVHVWTNRPIWPQGLGRPTDTPDVPETVHWNEWIGPARMRPYSPAYHPFKWRGWWEFGTGALGDMACHTLNMPYMALELRDPVSVQAETSGHNRETYPKWSIITYEFPSTSMRGALQFVWYDGGKRPDAKLLQGAQMEGSGALVVGEKGSLYAPGDYAEQGLQMLGGVEKPEVEFVRSPGHFEEWVRAIKGGEPAMSNFPDYASPLTETVLLGNLAVWADGKKVDWDAQTQTATGADNLDKIVRKEYREGWTIS